MFEMLITRWVDGEVALPAVESWPESVPVATAVYRSVSLRTSWPASSGFLFAGLIGSAIRRAFHLSLQDTLRATWTMRNCSYSKFLFSKDRFTLSTFNTFPHLEDVSLLTYR